MEVEGAFDTGRYLNVIECFVAAGSLLIFTCTKIHSAGKCPLEGACELRGFGLGGRDGWEEVSCPACALSLPFCPLDFLLWKKGNCLSSNEQLGWMDGWVAGWWLEGHETPSEWKEKEAERVEWAELERSVAKKKRGANDGEGIEKVHSWPACCYVWKVWHNLMGGLFLLCVESCYFLGGHCIWLQNGETTWRRKFGPNVSYCH